MDHWGLAVSGGVALGAAGAALFGHRREIARAEQLQRRLLQSAPAPARRVVDSASLRELPPPVARYFGHVLSGEQRVVRVATLSQSGVLRTSTTRKTWSAFAARQLVVPPAAGFVWNARVRLPLAAHLRVLDSYVAGSGAGHVSFLSALPVASAESSPELDSGALHRFLAEAVWYPTALLPGSGVVWSPIDEYAALATLTDRHTSVSLEFRVNEVGEVTGIFTPGRYGRFDGGFRQVPWEGHFRNYRLEAGMRVPSHGEVGWYDKGALQWVWKGDLLAACYEFMP